MRVELLERALDRRIKLSEGIWAKALLLGAMRTRTNGERAMRSDRGTLGNAAVDLHGAIGELILLSIVQRAGAEAAVRQMSDHMLNPEGGRDVAGPDLLVTTDEGQKGVDAKTFDCAPNKRFFAINDTKHQSLRNHCDWYFALLAPPLGTVGELVRMVPYRDVENWDVKQLRAGLNGSASRNLPITEFVGGYSSRPIDLASLSSRRYSLNDIQKLATDPGLQREFIQLIPSAEPFLKKDSISLQIAPNYAR